MGVSLPAFNCSRFGDNVAVCENILSAREYEVEHTFNEPVQNETHVILRFHEEITHEVARGGSSFLGFVESTAGDSLASARSATRHRLACDADHVTGFYTITCDISLITTDFRVDIWLEYLNHGAFVTPVRSPDGRRVVARLPLDSLIYSRKLVRVNGNDAARPARSDEICTAKKLHLDKGYWVSDSAAGGWEWSPSKCKLQSHKESMACFQRQVDTRGVVLMGASHMRYMFDAVVAEVRNATLLTGQAKKHGDMNAQGLEYKSVKLVREMARLLPSGNDTRIYVVQVGSHDLNNGTLDDFKDGLDRFAEHLTATTSTVIVMGTPPIPSHFDALHDDGYWPNKTFTNYGVSRNNFAVQASNEHFFPQLTRTTIIPLYDIALPQYQHTACDIHYICRPSRSTFISPVGWASIHALFNAVCDAV
jgi:hypothetical protein